jgi:hypothetical protein
LIPGIVSIGVGILIFVIPRLLNYAAAYIAGCAHPACARGD